MTGPIALVGGGEFLPGARELDAWLLERAKDKLVTVVPTAAAKERPDRAVENATRHFDHLDADVRAVMVLDRSDAKSPTLAKALRDSTFIYLTGGDPNYLLTVFRDSAVWEAIRHAHSMGAILAGSSAGAMILGDEMLVPGSNHPAKALGFFDDLLFIPHFSNWGRRIVQIALVMGESKRILGLDESTGIVIDSNHCWILGAGKAFLFRGEKEIWQKNAPAEVENCVS